MLNFTRQERRILFVLVCTFLVGLIIKGIQHNRNEKHLQSLESSARKFDLVYRAIASGQPEAPVQTEARISPQTKDRDTLRVDINSAPEKMLVQLPRIGPVLASRIVEYRTRNGYFHTLDDITKVKGIGTKTLERIRPYIYIPQDTTSKK